MILELENVPWRAARFQNVGLAPAPRTFVVRVCNMRVGRLQIIGLVKAPRSLCFKCCNSFTGGGRLVVKNWLSP
eukprot:2819886-Pyramimonas_sp.AAC.1